METPTKDQRLCQGCGAHLSHNNLSRERGLCVACLAKLRTIPIRTGGH